MTAPLSKAEILFQQRLLKAQGIYDGKLDGAWGPKTEAAVTEAEARADQLAGQLGTFDTRSEGRIRTLHLEAQRAARVFLAAFVNEPYTVRIISGTRTYAEQDALFAQGRTTPGKKVTNAKGGESNHNFGIAWDIGIFIDGKYETKDAAYKQAAPIALAVTTGVEWGGNWVTFPDVPHYQLLTGRALSETRKLFEKGKKYI
ncbi:MAG TPA: M15 family metallopeptidase [Thermoanaerobaculia bacterium]|nr:M15 family metallopeptidase [Thermoanaerobaculia bacterium]